jgi:hypothetical protein
MPATVLAHTVQVTKNTGSGNFQFVVQDAAGGVKLIFVLLSADMATAAALGGGASATFTYPQDGPPSRVDYPNSYTEQTGS